MRFFNSTKEEPTGIIRLITSLSLSFLPLLFFFATLTTASVSWAASPKIAAGGNHNVYLKTDGILGAWGNNYYGQLGDGTSGSATNKTAPVRVGTDTTWVGITAGGSHSVAVLATS
jgi:alpha-tubulin suppressor-like RCC1 family protein